MKAEKFLKYVEIKTLLNNQLVKGETTGKIRKCFETNKIKKKKNQMRLKKKKSQNMECKQR